MVSSANSMLRKLFENTALAGAGSEGAAGIDLTLKFAVLFRYALKCMFQIISSARDVGLNRPQAKEWDIALLSLVWRGFAGTA